MGQAALAGKRKRTQLGREQWLGNNTNIRNTFGKRLNAIETKKHDIGFAATGENSMTCSGHFRATLWLVTALISAHASAFELVSREEAAAAEKASSFTPRSAPVPNAPAIRVVSPDLNAPLKSPMTIQLAWAAAADAQIDLSSLKVTYGRLRLDITSRLLKQAKVSATGLEARDADLPGGTHRLFVSISDTRARETIREFILEVADK